MEFATAAIALYVAHHVGDYWVQTDHQAKHKGDAGIEGVLNCMIHVGTYLMTQLIFFWIVAELTEWPDATAWKLPAFLAVSGVTHYMADRREHGLMFKLARALPGKRAFLHFGKGQPTLATGAWALDQSWHIFWGVFVSALILAA
jgi:hypothetical protein